MNLTQQQTGTPTSPSSQDGSTTADTQCKNSKPTKADSTKGSGLQSVSGSTVIVLPWPPKELSPNARCHWAKLAKAKKTYRAACAWQAKVQGAKPIMVDKLHLTLTFHAPTRRAYHLDGPRKQCRQPGKGFGGVFVMSTQKTYSE